jgi:hypothetical protein
MLCISDDKGTIPRYFRGTEVLTVKAVGASIEVWLKTKQVIVIKGTDPSINYAAIAKEVNSELKEGVTGIFSYTDHSGIVVCVDNEWHLG